MDKDIKGANDAQERLNHLGEAAREHGKQASELARAGVGALAARMGKVALGASIVLWIAWFFLPALKVSMFGASQSFTFWDVLGADFGRQGMAGGSHGLWALVGLAALVSPVAAPFLRHPRAGLLNGLPLAYLILTAVKIRWGISSAVSDLGAAAGHVPPEMRAFASEMAKTAMQSLLSSLSIGVGAYAMVVAAIVLAFQTLKTKAATPLA